jgi:hypothetical protein
MNYTHMSNYHMRIVRLEKEMLERFDPDTQGNRDPCGCHATASCGCGNHSRHNHREAGREPCTSPQSLMVPAVAEMDPGRPEIITGAATGGIAGNQVRLEPDANVKSLRS